MKPFFIFLRRYSSHLSELKNVKCQITGCKQNVGVMLLNRPRAFNSLNSELMSELAISIDLLTKDDSISALVIASSSPRAFSIGADIKEMLGDSFDADAFLNDWSAISRCKKPIIAAVNGYAFGGGCEIAMACDIILAGETATFSQPEINIGTIPGFGGTQRLPRYVGKSLAMEMILTGCRITAREALQSGLVSSIHPNNRVLSAAIELGERIASQRTSLQAIAIKELINHSYEVTLHQGIKFQDIKQRVVF